jgi:hypothetical protein
MMRRMLILLVGALWAGSAFAQAQDCSQVPQGYRSRCQETQRLQQLCAGLADPARKTCIQKNIHYARLKTDCSLAKTPEKKANCARRNHMMDLAAPCSGKTGDAFKACADAAGVQGAGVHGPVPGGAPRAAQKPAPAATPAPGTAAVTTVPDAAASAAPGAAPR